MDAGAASAYRLPAIGHRAGVGAAPRAVVPLAGAAAAPRALSVDALRGLAILGMVLVAAEPSGVLPAWMYHAQTPPPSHALDLALPGLTWPDVVFPFFLFSMGVAIPLALAPRLDRGLHAIGAMAGALSRGALLLFFAFFRQHFDSSTSGLQPDTRAWYAAVAAFAVLCAIFTRLPARWPRSARAAVRAAGWAAAATMWFVFAVRGNTSLAAVDSDVILLILAYCAVFGTLIWLATRHSVLARLAVLALLAASRIGAPGGGWLGVMYSYDPAPWIYRLSILQFLCVVIPGTIVGDLLLRKMNEPRFELISAVPAPRWATGRIAVIAAAVTVTVLVVLAGIQSRHVFVTTLVASVLGVVACAAARDAATPAEEIIEQLVRWGAFWIVLGLLLDSFEGGTKKVPETYAWFFQGAGLALFTTIAFMLLIDVLGRKGPAQWLIDIGQNPMVGYVAYGMLVLPLLGLTHITDTIDGLEPPPWAAFAWSVLLTVGVALIVRVFTRRKLLWRT